MSICQLYRHFDADGALLYVGISVNALTRLAQHQGQSSWSHLISRVEIENHPDIEAARKAERRAIKGELPTFNVMMAHGFAPPHGEPGFVFPSRFSDLGRLGGKASGKKRRAQAIKRRELQRVRTHAARMRWSKEKRA